MPQSGAQSLTAPGATALLYRRMSGEPLAPGHETILHTLNKWKDYGNGPAYLTPENFLGTEPAWNAVPLIFAQDHPDLDLVRDDLPAALASVTDYQGNPGRIAGTVSDTAVILSGQPRVTLKTAFTDPAVQALYDSGMLSLSSAFYGDSDSAGHLVGKVRPNHVLVFVQNQKNQPVDQGAMFLNKEGGALVTQFTGIGKVISDKNRSRFKQALDLLTNLFTEMAPADTKNAKYEWDTCIQDQLDAGYDEETAAKICGAICQKVGELSRKAKNPELEENSTMDAEMEKQLAASKAEQERLAKELSDAKTERDRFKAKVDEMEKAAKEAAETARKAKQEEDWNLAKTALDVGLFHKPEAEAALRTEFEANPAAFMAKHCAKKPADPKKEDGTQYGAKGGEGGDPAKPTALDVARELRNSTGRGKR